MQSTPDYININKDFKCSDNSHFMCIFIIKYMLDSFDNGMTKLFLAKASIFNYILIKLS